MSRYIFCDAIIITQLDDASYRDAYQAIAILHEQLKSYMIIANAISYLCPTEVPVAIILKVIYWFIIITSIQSHNVINASKWPLHITRSCSIFANTMCEMLALPLMEP